MKDKILIIRKQICNNLTSKYCRCLIGKCATPKKTMATKLAIMPKHKKIRFMLTWVMLTILFVASFAKLWLVSGQHLVMNGYAQEDDRLFINLANNLLHDQWLGAYNNLTLAKGPFYPIFIAIVNYINLPLLLAEQLFYLAACCVSLVSLWPLLNADKGAGRPGYFQYVIIIFLGLLLIFNPMTFSVGVGTTVSREGIYPALTLLTLSFFLSLLSYRKIKLLIYTLVSIAAGLSLTAFWLTREEGMWIMPLLLGLTAYVVTLIAHQRDLVIDWKARIALLCLPFTILFLSIHVVSFVNYKYYGIYNTVEVKTPEFVSAYSSLLRVKNDTWLPQVPLSVHNRQLIYEVSPAFAELKPYMENGIGVAWTRISESYYPQYKGEIAGGWLQWAFRSSVYDAGHYSSGQELKRYYTEMADQVNAACSQGNLTCAKSSNGMNPPLDKRYIKPFLATFYDSFFYLTEFKGFSPYQSGNDSLVDPDSMVLISNITHQPASNYFSQKKLQILGKIGNVYQNSFLVLTYLSLLLYLSQVFFKRSYRDPLFIATGLVGMSILIRMALLSMIETTSFAAINTYYFSSTYVFLILFDFLGIVLFYKFIMVRLRRSKRALDV